MKEILDGMMKALVTNFVGPNKYLNLYEQYYYILNGTAERELMDFFGIEPFPFLKASRCAGEGAAHYYCTFTLIFSLFYLSKNSFQDFAKKIYMYEDQKKEMMGLRRRIPLNLICLDCSDLNEALITILDNLRSYIVNYYVTENHNHNRR